jgi:transposase
MRALPIPIRKRILELYEQGKSTREIAPFAGFCIAAVRRVRQQFRERGRLEPRTYLGGRKTLLSEERKQRLHRLLSAPSDATRAELARLSQLRGYLAGKWFIFSKAISEVYTTFSAAPGWR